MSDDEAAIAELAKLSVFEYERTRDVHAERLGVRVAVLDKLVEAARSKDTPTAGQGRAFLVPEVEPWTEKVDGAKLLDDAFESYTPFQNVTTSQSYSRNGFSDFQNVTAENRVTLPETSQAYSRNDCDGVTFREPQNREIEGKAPLKGQSERYVPPDRRPALGPPGDSLDDLPEPGIPGFLRRN